MAISGFTHMYRALNKIGVAYRTLAIPKPWRRGPWTPTRKNSIIKQLKVFNPHCLLIMKDTYFDKLLPLVRAKFPKLKIMMWYGDQRGRVMPPLIAKRAKALDCLLVTHGDPKQKQMYKRAGIPHVYTFYHSFDEVEFKLWNEKITHDVFFGGTNFALGRFPLSRIRRDLVYTIQKKFKMVVRGGGWPFPTEKWVLRNLYARELRKANINLGINHYNVRQYYNRRLFESVASGRLHITYYVPGMEKHFTNHKHLVWFKSIGEGVSQIKYYLKNPKKREKIAKQGRDFFMQKHAWPTRATQFKKIMERLLK